MNPHRGDLTFEAGGKSYTLRYSHRSLVLLEDKLDKGLVQIMKEVESWKVNPEHMRLGTICAILWAGLQKHQPDMSLEDATEILDELDGGTSTAIELLGKAFERAFNAPGTKGTNPPVKTENGTGIPSSSIMSPLDTIPTNSGKSLQGS